MTATDAEAEIFGTMLAVFAALCLFGLGCGWVHRAAQRPGASRLILMLERVRKAIAHED